MKMMRNGLIDEAKEELEILEFQHPNKYESMKMDLKALIAHLQSISPTPSLSAAPTQESSSRRRKKRKRSSYVVEDVHIRCRTDVVLHRAQQCLNKIQLLKTTFF